MFEHILKMIGFKPEHIEEVIAQVKVMAALVTEAVKESSAQRNDIAFIAAHYRAKIMRDARLTPDDNDLFLIDTYYPVHNPLPTGDTVNESAPANELAPDIENVQAESVKVIPITTAEQIAANMAEPNPNIGKS